MGELQRVMLPPRSSHSWLHPHVARGTETAGHTTLPRMMAGRALQPQLVIGPVGDAFEHEAERTADRVTGSAHADTEELRGPVAATLTPVAQRTAGKGEEARKRKDGDERKPLQKQPSATGSPDVVTPGLEARIQAMSAGGRPLEPSTRSYFESRFGYDFGSVRTHTGDDAAAASRSLGARAFTVGDHVFFGQGEYRPDVASSRHLISHELTHTIQQQPSAARAARLLPVSKRVQRSILSDAHHAPPAHIPPPTHDH